MALRDLALRDPLSRLALALQDLALLLLLLIPLRDEALARKDLVLRDETLARQELALRDLALTLWDLALRASWLSHGRPW